MGKGLQIFEKIFRLQVLLEQLVAASALVHRQLKGYLQLRCVSAMGKGSLKLGHSCSTHRSFRNVRRQTKVAVSHGL